MKLGFTMPFDYGGISTYARHLLWELSRYPDLELHVYSLISRKAHAASAFNHSPRFRYRNALPHDLMLGKHLALATRFIQEAVWLRESFVMDLIHHASPLDVPQWARNTVVTVHDIFPLYMPALPGVKEKLEQKFQAIFHRSRLIFAPTQFVKNDIAKRLGVPPEKIRVTYEAASPDFRRIEPDWSTLKKYDLSPETPFLFHVGRIDYRKNLERMVEAYFALPSRLKRRVEFVVATSGDKTELYRAIERGKARGEGGTVKVIGSIPFEDLLNLYNAALGFAFVSIAEGFGIPLLEAMRCGCPVIASTETSLPEIAGDAALFANPLDVEAISEAMRRLIEEPELRDALRRKGFERAERFSWAKMAQETLEGYKAALRS
ncbi:MAG: glycosyltransferase family 4 protein [Chloroherpetonaceae bacterium]|nr:glycosyltransferase family 4 protein [Chloroherpetonaceae bacterium]MDW8438342.1 glycosyltransferase family 1 protein [Chloroherpetonaceae bacterium]